MNHSEIKSAMPDYLEGDLPLDRRALYDAHLDECPECAGEIAAMRSTIGALRALPDPEVPPHLVDDVMRRIRLGEGQRTFADWLREFGETLFSPRVLAPASVAMIAAGVIIGTQPLREAIEEEAGIVAGTTAPIVVVANPEQPVVPTPTPAAVVARSADRTPGQELIAQYQVLADRSIARSPLVEWPMAASDAAPSVPVASRSQDLGGSSFSRPGPYRPAGIPDAAQRYPSADEWLSELQQKPAAFADQMASRTLAEQEHWIDSLARRAIETGQLEQVVASLRSSASHGARVLADDFAAAGAQLTAARATETTSGQ